MTTYLRHQKVSSPLQNGMRFQAPEEYAKLMLSNNWQLVLSEHTRLTQQCSVGRSADKDLILTVCLFLMAVCNVCRTTELGTLLSITFGLELRSMAVQTMLITSLH